MTARVACAALAAAVALAAPVAAQSGVQPTVVLSIFGGVQTGYHLWTVAQQPLCVLDTNTHECTASYDTLRLSRHSGSTLSAGLTAMYFPRPHVGIHAQLAYHGFPLDDDCAVSYAAPQTPDTDNNYNEQTCNAIRRAGLSGGSMSALLGLTLRKPTPSISPFLRIATGIVTRPQSSVRVAGDFLTGTGALFERTVLADDAPKRTWIGLLLGAGFTLPLGPGYQLRLEARDLIGGVARPTGPADDAGRVATASRSTHSFALTVGLDIVLEQRRGRRY